MRKSNGNGAAPKAAKTSTLIRNTNAPAAPQERQFGVVINGEGSEAKVRAEIEIPPRVYGSLCAAAIVNGFDTWQDALVEMIESQICDLENREFVMRD
jgi:hypothetical protein